MSSNSSNAGAGEGSLLQTALSGREARLSDKTLFFKKFLAKGRTISSAVPSSRALVDGVLRHVDFTRPATIVELGAGTGAATETIVDRLRPYHRFVAVENDHDFCEVLRRRFPEVTLLEADATLIADPLARMGIERVDYVISGLPSPNLPPRAAVRLWRWLKAVMPASGLFLQITVAPLVYRAFYDRLFSSVRYRMVWWNMPPGGVYRCAQPRQHLTKSR